MASTPERDDKRKPDRLIRRGGNIPPRMMHLQMETLINYLEGGLSPDKKKEVALHLKGCNACKKHLKQIYVILEGIDEHVEKHRKECPTPEVMVEFVFGKLSKTEKENVQKHLSECPYCIAFQRVYDEARKGTQNMK